MAALNDTSSYSNRTARICGALVLAGIAFGRAVGYYSFHAEERLAAASSYAFCAYMLGVPMVLWLLKGERLLRTLIFLAWLAVTFVLGRGLHSVMIDQGEKGQRYSCWQNEFLSKIDLSCEAGLQEETAGGGSEQTPSEDRTAVGRPLEFSTRG
jgi:hypothetical protein